MSTYRNTLEAYLKTLDIKCDRVLDVAGASNPVSTRVKSWDVKHYAVLDNELERQAIRINIKHDMNMRLNEIDTTWQYDTVFCLELMEYIWNPVQATVNLRYFCHPESRLIITFPFVYPNHNPVGFDMMRYTKQGAIQLLRNAGFTISDIIPRHMAAQSEWLAFMDADHYKYKGAMEAGTLFDAGYIIEAHPTL